MHKVNPSVRTISTSEDFSLRDITVVTLKNTGTHSLRWGFGDGFFVELGEGQSISFDAGANTVFSNAAVLKLEFVKPEVESPSDFASVLMIYNRLTEQSSAWANMVSK